MTKYKRHAGLLNGVNKKYHIVRLCYFGQENEFVGICSEETSGILLLPRVYNNGDMLQLTLRERENASVRRYFHTERMNHLRNHPKLP